MRRAVFLDRDGVINRAVVREGKPYPPANLATLEILPGVTEALTALHQAGFILIVVTNQPDVARGTVLREVIEEINNYIISTFPIDEIRTCFHDNGECDCRKPLPGALLAAAKLHSIDMQQSFMVGDRWRDTEAGARAGCKTIFIDYGYAEKKPEFVNYRVTSLQEASKLIIGETK
jgi:D-glycero-D-manno-heptose 1,7-bisphosphate phosphatase